jgi:hypothetical protein
VFVRSVIGVGALLVAFGPLVVGSRAVRRRLFPGWSGPPGWLVQFVLVLVACLVVVLGLGVLGWFSVVPVTLALAASGVGMWLVAGRLRLRAVDAPVVVEERLGTPARVVAVVAVACVAATWGSRTYVALSHGMVSIDSLWYHLPLAARYSDLGSITGIHHDVESISGFYAINAELVHSLGMVLLGNDVLSMLLNVGWGVVALLAAWCIGRPHGVSAVCVTGLSVLLCSPAFVATQPGAAHNDIVGVALMLTAAALLVSADRARLTRDWVVLALAAMVIGVAVGTKWTLLPIAGAFAVGVVVLAVGRRLRVAALWAAAIGVLGGFSYVRNLIKADNPLPALSFRVGPIDWERKIPSFDGMTSLSTFLFDSDAWRNWFVPGLGTLFGYGWWAVVVLVLLGFGLSILTGPGPLTRMLGCVAAVGFVGYLVQPQVLEVFGQPVLFTSNVRYAAAALAFGLVLLPLSPLFARRAMGWLLTGGLLAIVLVMQFDSAVWPVELRELRMEEPARGADAVAGLVAGTIVLAIGLVAVLLGPRLRSSMASRRASVRGREARTSTVGRRAAIAAAVVGVSVVAIVGLESFYLAHRYTRPEAATPFLPEHWYAWEWARDIDDARIGYRPPALSYPLYGNRLSNRVEQFPDLVGGPGDPPPESREACMRFREMVNDRRYDYVVLFSFLAPAAYETSSSVFVEQTTPEREWLESDPAAEAVVRRELEAVYRIGGALDPSACPGG